MTDFPAISGQQLIRLLVNDGWIINRKANHGMSLSKYFPELKQSLVTIIPDKNKPLTENTLGLILGSKQTQIGKKGLRALIDKHGLN